MFEYIHCNKYQNFNTQSYKFTSHIAAFLSVVLITEMLEICIQTSNDQNVQLILKSYLPVVYGTTLRGRFCYFIYHQSPDVSSACFVVHVHNVIGHNLSLPSLLKKYHEQLYVSPIPIINVYSKNIIYIKLKQNVEHFPKR